LQAENRPQLFSIKFLFMSEEAKTATANKTGMGGQLEDERKYGLNTKQ